MNYQSAISLLLVLANLHGSFTARIVTTTSSKTPYLHDHLTVTCSIINAKMSDDLPVRLMCPVVQQNSGGLCHDNCKPVCMLNGCHSSDPLFNSSCTKIEQIDPSVSQNKKNITFTHTFRNIQNNYSGNYTCKYGSKSKLTQIVVRSFVRPRTTMPKTTPKDVASRPNCNPTTKSAGETHSTASRNDKTIFGIERQDFHFVVILIALSFSFLLFGLCIICYAVQRHYRRGIPINRYGNRHCHRILCSSETQEDEMGLDRNTDNTEYFDQVPLRYLGNTEAVDAHESRYPNSLNIPATDVYEDPPSPHTNGYANGHIPGPRQAASMGPRGSSNRMLKSSRDESVEIPLNRYLSLIELQRQIYSGGDSAGDSSLNDEPRLPRSIRPKHRHSSQRSVRSLGAPRRREESPEDIYL